MRLLVMALCASLAAPALGNEEVALGLPAPAFSLRTMNPDLAGTGWLALDRYAGEEPEDEGSKLVVLSFFASWCAPCKKEMPFLVQLDKMYRDLGLRVIGVCIDTEEPGLTAAKKMMDDAKVTYPVVSDRFNFLARRYLGDSAPLPSVFLIRRDGAIAKIERGYSKDVGALMLASIQQELGVRVEPIAAKPDAPAKKAPPAKKGAPSQATAGGDGKATPSGAEVPKPGEKPAAKAAPPAPATTAAPKS
jgi:thiol-disulfide isomerase/thioredoxin